MITLVTGYAGAQHITSDDAGSFNAAMMGNGEFVMDRGNKFTATIEDNNIIKISDGDILMQGRHIRIKPDDYEELDIEEGITGCKRHDLIVVTYEKNEVTSVETAKLEVLTGIPVADGSETDPEYETGDLLAGAIKNQMPLYRVNIDGLTIKSIDALFKTTSNFKNISDSLNKQVADEKVKWNLQVNTAITNYEKQFNDAYEEITDKNILVALDNREVSIHNIVIATSDWNSGSYTITSSYIKQDSIIDVYYASGTEITPAYIQSDGKLIITVETVPTVDITIDAILIVNSKVVSE